jgi:hypothetical protein
MEPTDRRGYLIHMRMWIAVFETEIELDNSMLCSVYATLASHLSLNKNDLVIPSIPNVNSP